MKLRMDNVWRCFRLITTAFSGKQWKTYRTGLKDATLQFSIASPLLTIGLTLETTMEIVQFFGLQDLFDFGRESNTWQVLLELDSTWWSIRLVRMERVLQ